MDIVEEMRGFEIDHEPDGWPGVRMRQVSALCDEIERLRGFVAHLAPSAAPPAGQNTDTSVSLASQPTLPSVCTTRSPI